MSATEIDHTAHARSNRVLELSRCALVVLSGEQRGRECVIERDLFRIGKSETSTTVAGESLGLTGNGKKYSDFSWAGPNKATPGQPNTGQTF